MIKRSGLIEIVRGTIKCHINKGAYYFLSLGPGKPYDLLPGLFVYVCLTPLPLPTPSEVHKG